MVCRSSRDTASFRLRDVYFGLTLDDRAVRGIRAIQDMIVMVKPEPDKTVSRSYQATKPQCTHLLSRYGNPANCGPYRDALS